MNTIKFLPGQRYIVTDWFTGGRAVYTVEETGGGKVTFTLSGIELDGEYTGRETFNIKRDPDGSESVLLYEYKGYELRIYAEDMEVAA